VSATNCILVLGCFFLLALTPDIRTLWTLPVIGTVDDPRDLKTVENDLAKSSDQKEMAYTDINRLNNEQKDLNEKVSRLTNQAATAERNAREKEDLFKRDQESSKRKDELNYELKKLAEEDKELDKQVRRRHALDRFITLIC
jgi:Skp family chaperone for outer membrane proteins